MQSDYRIVTKTYADGKKWHTLEINHPFTTFSGTLIPSWQKVHASTSKEHLKQFIIVKEDIEYVNT